MTEKGMSRRKLLATIGATGAAAGVGGAGTFAYLSDEKKVESTLETGKLFISVDPETMEFNDLNEGEESETKVTICNTGTLPVRNVILKNITLGGTIDVAKALEVTSVTYAGVDIKQKFLPSDQNGNGIVDLYDVVKGLRDFSLTNAAGEDGLDKKNDKDGKEGECRQLVIITKIDYSNLKEGLDKESVTATLDMRAEQKPLQADTSTNTTQNETG